MENKIRDLKNEYEMKINELKICIQKTSKTHIEVNRKQTAENLLEQKINLLHKSLMNLKNILPENLRTLK